MSESAILSAEEFKVDRGYRFPFVALDPTPGGSSLGVIEWSMELVFKKEAYGENKYYRLRELIVGAGQTRDPRYVGKLFLVECNADMFYGARLSDPGNSFTELIWAIRKCETHENVVLTAYPQHHHTSLLVDTCSSLSVEARFE